MGITIRIVTDNYVFGGEFRAEHGFSAIVEREGVRIIFDFGKTAEVFRHNFLLTGVEADEIDFGVISHGHYDHTGGVAELLKLRHAPLKIFAHPSIFSNRFAMEPGGNLRYIGIYWSKHYLEGLGAHFEFTTQPVEISPGIWASGPIPRHLGFEGRSPKFKRMENGKLVEDTIPDDQALFVKTLEGLLVITGCCHSGILNTLDHAKKVTGTTKIRLVVGGTHLAGYETRKLKSLFEELEKFDVEEFRLSHCTGLIPFAELYKKLPGKVKPTKAGDIIEIG